MGVIDTTYYERALSLLVKLVGRTQLVIFSDDIGAARQLSALQNQQDAIFIDPPSDSRPLESLLLMSQAHHLVTANSTFSWWAGWLGERKGRWVLCPRPWLDMDTFDERDLIYPTWISVGRDHILT
jgi:hypothetical protein